MADTYETYARLEPKLDVVAKGDATILGQLRQVVRTVLLCQLSDRPYFPDGRSLGECLTASTLLHLNETDIRALSPRTGISKIAGWFRALNGVAPHVHAEGFDAAICLYDVIGSYCYDDANVRLLEKLLSLVKPKAPVAVSVMSFDYMQALATHQSNGDAQRYLPRLEPSDTMEKTGDVFHPERVLLDKKLRLAFRKEKFLSGEGFPEELLVVDRRYSFEELRTLCDARMDVESIGYVRAGHFEVSDKTEKPTKEILVIGRKRLA